MTMKKTIILLVAIAIATMGGAQTFPNYTLSVETTTWQSIAATGTLLSQAYASYTHHIAMPFDLEFGSATIMQDAVVKVSARGRINFGQYGAYNYAYTHWNSPSGEFAIIPYFVRISEMASGGSCYYLVRDDDRGGQELVVEWNGLRRYGASGDNVSYQVRLHSNGDISVCYGPMTLQADFWDTNFTFALVHDNATDRILTTGSWSTDSTITLANPSQIGSLPLMHGVPQEGLQLTLVRPLPPCPHPTRLTVNSLWQQGATLYWNGNGVAGAQYLVQYDSTDFTPGTGSVPTHVANDTTYTITGLQPDHQYYAYVRSHCGTDTSRWESVQFVTPCEVLTHADLPYEQHFETSNVTCWRKLGTLSWSLQSGIGSDMVRFCDLFNVNSYAIMPPIDWVDDLQVTFRVKNGPVMVGVMDDPSDTSTFTPIHECYADGAAWRGYTVRLSRYDGSGQYIAFCPQPNQYGIGGCDIDYVALDTIQGCITVENLRVTHHSATTAEVCWNDYDSVGHYLVKWSNGIITDSALVTTQSFTLSALTPETQYDLSVRILCDSLNASPDTTIRLTTYPSCMKPLAVSVDNAFGTSATIHWTEVNSPGTYRVALRETYGDTVRVDTVTADTTITYHNLVTNRQYTVYVAQICSGVPTGYEWETFIPAYSCAMPQGVNIDTLGDTWASITIYDSLSTNHMVVVAHGTHSDTMIIDTLHFTLTDLQAATSYIISVRTVCYDSSYSNVTSTTFATPCSTITHSELPYIETFDDCLNGNASTLSPCWTIRSYAPSNYVGMFRPVESIHYGTSGLSFFANASEPEWPMFIALPEVDSLADLVLSMAVYCSWAGDSKVDIGYMTDPADSSTFHPLDTYIPAVARQWVEVEVHLAGTPSTVHHAALRLGTVGSSMGSSFYIDNVTLGLDISCEAPDSLALTNLIDTSVVLTIAPATDADSDAVAFQVVLVSPTGNDTLITDSTTITLEPLAQATDYRVSVRSICPEGGMTMAREASFTTLCGLRRITWGDDFESYPTTHNPRCWTGRAVVRSSSVHSGNRALHSTTISEGSHDTVATPELAAFDGPTLLEAYIRAFEDNWTDSIVMQLEIGVMTDSTYSVIFSDKVLYTQWTRVQHVIPSGLITDGARITFIVSHVTDSSYHPVMFYLDDISITSACLPVTDIEVVVVDTVPSGFAVQWRPQGTEDSWTIHMWSDNSDTSFVATQPYSMLPVQPLASYCLAIEPFCNLGTIVPDSSRIDTLCFTTPDLPGPGGVNSPERPWCRLYPNPSHGEVTIEASQPATVAVIDVSGRTVFESAHLATFHLRLPRGAYFVRIVTSEGCQVRKLVVR